MININPAQMSFTIVFLFLLSVISLAFYLERLFLLIKIAAKTISEIKAISSAAEQVNDCKNSGSISSEEFFKKNPELMNITSHGSGANLSSFIFNYNIEFDGLIESLKISIMKLGSIAALAPYIGLFGTVLGIMEAFSDIARTGTSNFAYVSKGISEALTATAVGLFLAVTASFFYNHLLAKIKNIQNIKDVSVEKINHIIESRCGKNA